MTVRVMITGAASGVGHGIAKALRKSGRDVAIVFADISPFNPGFFRVDDAIVIPKVEEPGALSRMIALLTEHRIDVVMIGSVFDLEFFAVHRDAIEHATGVLIVVSPPEVIRMAADKWLTAEFLRQNGFPYAESSVPRDVDEALTCAAAWGYPLILKTRTGRGSRHVHVVRSNQMLAQIFPLVPEPMLQRLIAEPSDDLAVEYTCAIVKLPDGRIVGPFTARRALRGGHSWVVEVDHFPALDPLLLAIGRSLPIVGPFNVQLMIGRDCPVPFEFNARFSGTTPIRAHFGFNETAIILEGLYDKMRPAEPVIRRGLAFRYFEEVFLDGMVANDVKAPYPRGTVHDWF